MYPYLLIGGEKFYIMGIGIVISLIIFLISIYFKTKKYNQSFVEFIYFLPWFLGLIYILGKYFYFIFIIGLYPHSRDELNFLITPRGYNFSLIGLMLGYFIGIFLFLLKIRGYENRKIRIDIFFSSTAITFIFLGIFLTLSDNFVGKPTDGFLGISPFTQDSELTKYGKVYPIGLFFSFASAITLLIYSFLKYKNKKFGYGFIGNILFLLLLAVIILFQQYPKHGILPITKSLVLDIKHYFIFLFIMLNWIFYEKYKI